jgi:hypothetical protein
MSLLRLELDPEQIEAPFVVAARGVVAEHRCEQCRTTWFEQQPGPLEVDLEAPEGGWDVLVPGSMPGDGTPLLVVAAAVAERLTAAGVTSFEAHPVAVATVDGEPGYDGPAWVALFPTGTAGGAWDPADGDDVEPCEGCGRYAGEFEHPWSWGLSSHDGDLLRVPGWGDALFATESAWAALQDAGVQFLRALPVPTR